MTTGIHEKLVLRPLMHYLERRLHARDDGARVSHPFEWGLEFIGAGRAPIRDAHAARRFIKEYNEKTLASSDFFYTPEPSRRSDFESSVSESDFHWLNRSSRGIGCTKPPMPPRRSIVATSIALFLSSR